MREEMEMIKLNKRWDGRFIEPRRDFDAIEFL